MKARKYDREMAIIKKQNIAAIGKVTAESVYKATKKTWDEWVPILNKAGAKNMTFREITKFLAKKYKLGTWWQGAVAAGYEIHIGRRIEGRNQKGEYSVTATKSIKLNRDAIWDFITSEAGQALWLRPMTPIEDFAPKTQFEVEGGIYGEIRTLKPPERLRMRWQDTEWPKPSVLNIGIAQHRPNSSILYVMHEALASPRLREQMREYWRERLEEVKRAIEN